MSSKKTCVFPAFRLFILYQKFGGKQEFHPFQIRFSIEKLTTCFNGTKACKEQPLPSYGNCLQLFLLSFASTLIYDRVYPRNPMVTSYHAAAWSGKSRVSSGFIVYTHLDEIDADQNGVPVERKGVTCKLYVVDFIRGNDEIYVTKFERCTFLCWP